MTFAELVNKKCWSSYIATATNIQESLNVWSGQGSPNTGTSVDIQEFSQQTIKISSSITSSVSETAEATEEDPVASKEELKIRMMALGNLKLVSFSGGRQTGAGFGLIYSRSETQIERSRVSFAAEGVVKTADGKEINLNLNFNIDQEVVQQSNFQLRAGEALKDPLVISFGGSVASFADRTMSFDIDFDGDQDTLQMRKELFGPQTDHGYGELAQYDEDGNGWIDENDSVFNHLKIWYHDEQGNSQLVALTGKNVGAIYLGSVETQMNMYRSSGMAGALRESGLVLLENGESRVMQELDVRI